MVTKFTLPISTNNGFFLNDSEARKVDVSRKSIALYYYKSWDSVLDIQNYSTIFRFRPNDENRILRAAFKFRVNNYFGLKKLPSPKLY